MTGFLGLSRFSLEQSGSKQYLESIDKNETSGNEFSNRDALLYDQASITIFF